MQIDTKTIRKHFQKSIDKYEQNALVQKLMAQKIVDNLPSVEGDFLEIGSGAGVLTKLLSGFNYNIYCANDLVEKSEIYVKKYIPSAQFFAGDFRRIKFHKTFDLIASNAVFQWCDNLDKVFSTCWHNLKSSGILAFSTFSCDNFFEFREISGLSLDYKSLNELVGMLSPNFEIIYSEQFKHKLHFDNPLQILAHMKNTGVNSLSEKSWGITEVREFCDNYRSKFPDLNLTYSPIIIVCRKLN